MNFRGFAAALVVVAGVLGLFTTGVTAQDDNVFKLAFVAFLSGPAAEIVRQSGLGGRKDGHRCAQCRKPAQALR